MLEAARAQPATPRHKRPAGQGFSASQKIMMAEQLATNPRARGLPAQLGLHLIFGYLHENAVGWPKHETLCRELGCSKSALKRAIKILVQLGWQTTPGSGRTSTRYGPAGSAQRTVQKRPLSQSEGGPADGTPVAPQRVHERTPTTSKEPFQGRSFNRKGTDSDALKLTPRESVVVNLSAGEEVAEWVAVAHGQPGAIRGGSCTTS
jgi:hypothetical protein